METWGQQETQVNHMKEKGQVVLNNSDHKPIQQDWSNEVRNNNSIEFERTLSKGEVIGKEQTTAMTIQM